MADRILTINNADGSSETYTINREAFEGVRSMSVDGETVTVDHTEQDDIRTLLVDGQTITLDNTATPIRTITIDGVEVTIDRSDEVVVQSFIEQFTAPKIAFSLRDLITTTGDTTVVDVRRSTDNTTDTFTAAEVADGTLTTWVGAGNEGFVSKWYDQSGNGSHAFQSDPTKQPKIVDASGLIEGGLDFNDAEALTTTDTFTFPSGTTLSSFITNRSEVHAENAYLLRFFTNYIVWRNNGRFRRATAGSNASFGRQSNSVINEELWSLFTELNSSGGTSNLFVNGSRDGGVDVYSGTKVISPARNFEIGGPDSSAHWIGTINEIIIYDTDQSANRESIEANIISKYGV